MLARDGYPAGVPCWIDVVQADPDRTMAFSTAICSAGPMRCARPTRRRTRYAYARIDGLTVGGVGGPPTSEAEGRDWTTYISVASADDAAHARGGKRRPGAGAGGRHPARRAGGAVRRSVGRPVRVVAGGGEPRVPARQRSRHVEFQRAAHTGSRRCRAVLRRGVRLGRRTDGDGDGAADAPVAGRGLRRFPGRARPADPCATGRRPGARRLRRCRRPPGW